MTLVVIDRKSTRLNSSHGRESYDGSMRLLSEELSKELSKMLSKADRNDTE